MKKPLATLVLVLTAAGCAYRPVVDTKRSNMANYETDLAECRQLSDQAAGAGTGAAVGAAAGYAVGQVFARTTGRSGTANEAGRGGAVLGAAGGAGKGAAGKRQIIANCMKGRGYAVLD